MAQAHGWREGFKPTTTRACAFPPWQHAHRHSQHRPNPNTAPRQVPVRQDWHCGLHWRGQARGASGGRGCERIAGTGGGGATAPQS